MHTLRALNSAGADQTMREKFEEADANLLLVINDMREAARVADDNNDPGTEALKKRDGLAT